MDGDLTDQVVVSGDKVNPGSPSYYQFTYTGTNQDGVTAQPRHATKVIVTCRR